ncbi:AzlD domain-containing protein [Kiloniella laminariae]|uniref:AzlD domain-containing protein n=1 Tax=Kiloniella laminariae TaxID=454162 RepID=A0ABT4LMN4_9PROT|nr:AzlD domain-containing protein [Kiloniella laminariae]MCZ4282382.1 AzlD domain-containing protein [Kiloniella laminariae]
MTELSSGFLTPEFLAPLAALGAAAIVTYFWRALGVAVSGKVDKDSSLFRWVTCVAYALLAGLISRMILLPIGPLAELGIEQRAGATVISLAVFFLTRKNLLIGVASGAIALVLMAKLGPL